MFHPFSRSNTMKKFVLLALFFALFSFASADARIWTSRNGKTIEAELVEFKDGVAKLKKKDGAVVSVKQDLLSQEDVDYLNQQNSPEKSSEAETRLDVFAISVAKEMPTQDPNNSRFMMGHTPGTVVSLMVPTKEGSLLIALDEEKSKLSKFTDEKNSDLTKKLASAPKPRFMFGNNSASPLAQKILDDEQKWVIIDCIAPNRPVAGSKTVRLEGKLVLRCGKGSVVKEHKNISLDGKGKFEAGGTTVTLKLANQQGGFQFGGMEGNETKMSISLTSNKSLDAITGYTFKNSEGKEIDFQEGGYGYGGDTVFENYELAEKVDSLTIVTEEYELVEEIEIPFAQTVSLDL